MSSLTSWSKTAPTPTSLTSTASLNSFEKSGVVKTAGFINIALILSKANWQDSVQENLTSFLNKFEWEIVIVE